jgi:dTDP-4-amino-4,6-dideoxygalactose transaminase
VGREFLDSIPSEIAFGGLARDHTFWIFPIVCRNPEEWRTRLLSEGFDAARSSSSLQAVSPPPERPGTKPAVAEAAMNAVIYLPVYPEMSVRSREKLARLVNGLAEN